MAMLFNRERARELLDREGCDGLLAARPINQYYVSGYWGLFNTPVGYDGCYFALVPADDTRPGALVMPALEIRRLETVGGTWLDEVHAYSGPGDGQEPFEDGTPRGSDYAGWPVRAGTTLGPVEGRWVGVVLRMGQRMSPDAFWAVARALKAAGLEKARLLVDDHRAASWLATRGVDTSRWLYRPDLFNEIRLVKTSAELELLRTAARLNEAALLVAADALREGATWPEIEDVYMADLARRGGRGVYLMCGVGGLPGGLVRRGEPLLFDALGQFHHYHGDFGRCAVVGEPRAEHRRRHAALLAGWEAALEVLKPGRRYSEVARHVGEAVRRAGISDFRDPIVHGLGLEHTDDPKAEGVPPQTKPDQVLQENMVVNVDMPHTEIGWGSVHMEDTVRITRDGCERLGVADFGLRVVG
jgi:Xaa-Pro dipeptidase